MKLKTAKFIRVITVAALMAFAALCVLWLCIPSAFDSRPVLFILAVCFLTVLPLLAYPLQPFIPKFKDKGREGQRNLAMLFAVSGYILGCITNLFTDAPDMLWIVYLEYLISGALILIFNKVFKMRASAHACGVIGPAVMLFSFGIHWVLPIGIALWGLALWGSISMDRHTLPQYIGGTAIPIAVLIVLQMLF